MTALAVALLCAYIVALWFALIHAVD